MDKYEYKIRSEEIKTLIARGEYAEAAEIADTIDWRRVKSVMMLCTISDLYKINRRFEDSRDLLLLAYERHPGGRSIVYSLCELSIKMEEFVQAVEYYKEFVQVAPKDNGRYILQYKLYEAQDVSLEERIAVLEELKTRDYTEKWAYELAYLYHRVGLATRCVEECDELILWFGEGKYVLKAMELKMLHEPLTSQQQEKYNAARGIRKDAAPSRRPNRKNEEEQVANAPTREIPSEELDIQVKLMGVGQYDTINMQKELAGNMKDLWEGTEAGEETDVLPGESSPSLRYGETSAGWEEETGYPEDMSEEGEGNASEEVWPEAIQQTEEMRMEAIPAEERQTVDKREADAVTRTIIAPLLDDTEELDVPDELPVQEPSEEIKVEEVFFGETADMDATAVQVMEAIKQETEAAPGERQETDGAGMPELHAETVRENSVQTGENKKDSKFEKILGMEYDGQISLLLPESEQIEKQITGQIKLEDILSEWERMKKDSEQKRMEAVRQRVMEHTGAMFTEFEASMRDGLLEQLEGRKAAGMAAGAEISEGAEAGTEASVKLPGDAGETAAETEEPEILEGSEEELMGLADFDEEADETEELEEIDEAGEFGGLEDNEDIEGIEDIEDIDELENPEELEDSEDPDDMGQNGDVGETESQEEVEDIEDISGEPEYDESEETCEENTAAGEDEEIEETEETEEADQKDEETGREEEELEDSEDGPEEDEAVREPNFDEEEELQETEKPAVAEKTKAGKEKKGKEKAEKPEQAEKSVKKSGKKLRALSPEEIELFGAYIQNETAKAQIIHALDNITMASYTGNILLTGEEGMDIMTLAKNLIKEVQSTDSNFSGKIAKISGASLNKKDIEQTFDKLSGGALIVQGASSLSKEAAEKMHKALEQENRGIILLLSDTKKGMNKFLEKNHILTECFNIRIDVEALDNDTLVEYGKKYAREQEYSIDELGVLALHTRISDMQTSDHSVTVSEVKKIVDEAIHHANRKNPGHFFDILLAKRYDDEDMIILREKDFV